MPHYPSHIRNVGEQLISILDSGDTVEFTLAGQDALAKKVAAIKGLDKFFEDSNHVSKITDFLSSEYASADSSVEASTVVGVLRAIGVSVQTTSETTEADEGDDAQGQDTGTSADGASENEDDEDDLGAVLGPFATIISHSDLDEVLEEWRSQKIAGAIMKFFDAAQYYSLLTLVFIKKILSYSKYIVGFPLIDLAVKKLYAKYPDSKYLRLLSRYMDIVKRVLIVIFTLIMWITRPDKVAKKFFGPELEEALGDATV